MSLYKVVLMPLVSRMRETIPEALQPWYCDDQGTASKALPNARCLDFLVKFGPQYGYFPEPGKSYYICKAEDEDAACQAFENFGLDINYSREGSANSAASLGVLRRRRNGWSGWWTSGRLRWSPSALLLSGILRQRLLASLSACRYVQQVVADTALFFSPLEEVIRTRFLPALLGVPSVEIDGDYRQLLTHSVKLGGLAIRNPVNTASSVHKASLAATRHLTVSLAVDPATRFDPGAHRMCATEAGAAAQRDRLQNEQIFLDRCGRDKPIMARRDKRNCAAGAWLSGFPNRLNGTGLLAEEWRDNVHLRYNHSLLEMPAACDGCGAKMTVKHALLWATPTS